MEEKVEKEVTEEPRIVPDLPRQKAKKPKPKGFTEAEIESRFREFQKRERGGK